MRNHFVYDDKTLWKKFLCKKKFFSKKMLKLIFFFKKCFFSIFFFQYLVFLLDNVLFNYTKKNLNDFKKIHMSSKCLICNFSVISSLVISSALISVSFLFVYHTCYTYSSEGQPTNQLTNQPTNQTTNQPTNQPVNHKHAT